MVAWATTGYGQQTAQLSTRLQAAGHDVAISAFYGAQGGVLAWNGIRVYPAGHHPYGNDVILRHAQDFFEGEPGLILSLVDVWVLNAAELNRSNVATWVPIDHDPPPPRVLDFLRASQCTPIAMSRFGEKSLRDLGLNPLYAPHGIDTEVYSPRDRTESRQAYGLPHDAFVVGMVAANKGFPSRKGFSQALQAFKQFAETHKDALLYLHTEPHGFVEGVNFPSLIEALGLKTNQVVFSDPYRYNAGAYTPEMVAMLYSTFDVLLNPSFGEGFGIPIVEAQACGTPVITTNWTAMPELTGAGWTVEGDLNWTIQRSWWKVPYVSEIENALEDSYTRAAGMRKAARVFAKQYDADTVFDEHWRPTLATIQDNLMTLADPSTLIAA